MAVLREGDAEAPVEPQPGLLQLDPLLTRIRAAGVPVDFHVHGNVRAFPPGIDLTAYRVVQEALSNALKHAGPACAEVLNYGKAALAIAVTDDGRRSQPSTGVGHGLVGMRGASSPLRRHRIGRCPPGRRLPGAHAAPTGTRVVTSVLLVDNQRLIRDDFRLIINAERIWKSLARQTRERRPYARLPFWLRTSLMDV